MNFEKLDVDIIVVGGGIHGVGVAQAAAAAGYSVILFEKSTVASGTSSKSSKLIHGGLRYLESFQFSLVRSCLAERSLLLSNAPDLVKLVPFYIPVYRNTRRRPWKINLGLQLYHWLSGFKSPFKKLSASEWSSLDALSVNNLEAVFQYYDAQTDDAILTRAVARSAESLGAKIVTNTQFEHCHVQENACSVTVNSNGSDRQYRCRVLVNATGPAVNEVLKNCDPEQKVLEIDLVQGAHIVLDIPAKKGVYYLESRSDGRAVFAMPWKDKTLVGTTETLVSNSKGLPTPEEDEIKYLLQVYNDYFPEDKALPQTIIESFAGLRVLPRREDSIFSRNRDTVLKVDSLVNPRIITIYGGKLTAYRITAEKVLQRIGRSLPSTGAASNVSTRDVRLTI